MRKSVMIASAVLATVNAAQAAYLTNVGFETLAPVGAPAGQTFEQWSENGDVASVATVGLTGQSAKLQKATGTNSLYQNTTDPLAQLTRFVYGFDFATSDPGAATDRSLNINLRPGTASPTNGQINLRLVDIDSDGDGDFQAYNGTAWVTVLKDAATFSASESSLVSNHLEIVGDFAAQKYSLTVNGNVATDLSAFHGTVGANARLQQVTFETGNLATGAFYVVDNVSLVPEPAALGLLATSGLMIMRRRRV